MRGGHWDCSLVPRSGMWGVSNCTTTSLFFIIKKGYLRTGEFHASTIQEIQSSEVEDSGHTYSITPLINLTYTNATKWNTQVENPSRVLLKQINQLPLKSREHLKAK